MANFSCDLCGKPLLVDEDVRYVVKVEVYAAYDPMELTEEDVKKDRRDEIRALLKQLERMDEREIEESVYKRMRFDLCPACQRRYLAQPLPKLED